MAKTTDMTTGSPIRHIIAFAIPMLLGNIFQQLYNLVDTMIVGRFVGEAALAAVGATSSVNTLMIMVCVGLTNGAGIIISQSFGAGEREELRNSVSGIAVITAVLAVPVSIAGIIFAPAIMRLLDVPDEIISNSVLYMRIICAGLTAMAGYNCCTAILRSMGDSKTPLVTLTITSIVNIVLDLLFVVVFNWSVAGAALATIISQILSLVLTAGYIVINRRALMLDGLRFYPKRASIVKIIKTGIPSTLQSSAIDIGVISVQRLINSFGTAAIAAYSASTKIDSLAIRVIVTAGTALSVFSGQNIGAGELGRIKKALRQTLAMLIPTAMAIAAIILIFKRSIIGLFLDADASAEAVDIACDYLTVIGIGYIIASVMQSYLNVIRGAGDVNTSMVAGFSELTARVIASYVLVNYWGLWGIWIAVPLSWFMGCIIPVARYYSGKWVNKKLV